MADEETQENGAEETPVEEPLAAEDLGPAENAQEETPVDAAPETEAPVSSDEDNHPDEFLTLEDIEELFEESEEVEIVAPPWVTGTAAAAQMRHVDGLARAREARGEAIRRRLARGRDMAVEPSEEEE